MGCRSDSGLIVCRMRQYRDKKGGGGGGGYHRGVASNRYVTKPSSETFTRVHLSIQYAEMFDDEFV